jgi:hypothetical protein
MKFLVNGEFNNNRLLRVILIFTLFYVLLLWVTNILIYTQKIGMDYTSVVQYYLGSEEDFRNPVSYLGLLETTHIHLFLFAMALLLVNHLTVFLPLPQFAKLLMILISFTSGLLDIGSGWLIRFVSPAFAWLKIASFITFQISLLLLIMASFFALSIYKKYQERNGHMQ